MFNDSHLKGRINKLREEHKTAVVKWYFNEKYAESISSVESFLSLSYPSDIVFYCLNFFVFC